MDKLEKAEKNARTHFVYDPEHILHPAGGLTENFVYEPLGLNLYVYRTKEGKKEMVTTRVEYEDPEKEEKPHLYLFIDGTKYYLEPFPPKEWLFNLPQIETVEKWVKGEKQSLPLGRVWEVASIYLRTFLDFPHRYEFSPTLLFVFQRWLVEILPVVFYLGIKGEFGGGKTVSAEAVVGICRHGYLTGNTSPPFVARAIEEQKITLLVDELDSVAGTQDSDLNCIFRQGYRRGGKYSRINPTTLKPENFDIFSPKIYTVHTETEQALHTRTLFDHVRETEKKEFPIVNLDKQAFASLVYTDLFLWYMDNILELRDNEAHHLKTLTCELDTLDILDLSEGGKGRRP